MSRVYKKSELIREGYLKGLEAARKVLAETIQTADGRVIQNDARAWVDSCQVFVAPEGKPVEITLYSKNYDYAQSHNIDSISYDKSHDEIVLRSAHRIFRIKNARKVIYDYEIDEIPASFVTVDYGNTGELELPSRADFVCLDNCPKFVEVMQP